MTTLFDQVALALEPYPVTQTGLVSFSNGGVRIYFDFRVLELFDIEASRGVVQRYCRQCGKLCVIDRETMDNYFSYVGTRKFFSKLGKVTFAARFHFPGCSHPFTPEVPEDLKDLQLTDLSHLHS